MRALALAASIALVLIIAGCGDSASGTYVSTKTESAYLELKSDGTFFNRTPEGIQVAGTWEATDESVTLKLQSGLASRGRRDGASIIFDDGNAYGRR